MRVYNKGDIVLLDGRKYGKVIDYESTNPYISIFTIQVTNADGYTYEVQATVDHIALVEKNDSKSILAICPKCAKHWYKEFSFTGVTFCYPCDKCKEENKNE